VVRTDARARVAESAIMTTHMRRKARLFDAESASSSSTLVNSCHIVCGTALNGEVCTGSDLRWRTALAGALYLLSHETNALSLALWRAQRERLRLHGTIYVDFVEAVATAVRRL
jgi:hypothetical protein